MTKLKIFRSGIQIISLFFLFPLFLAIFYCPCSIPWIMCDSCPVFWCPSKYLRKPLLLFIGALTIFSGRTFCSFFCPFGALQDFLNGISRKVSKKGDLLINPRPGIKFISLLLFIIMALEVSGHISQVPLDLLTRFRWLPLILGISLFVSVFISRFWCRFLCPLGALLSLANRFSLIRLKFNEDCKGCEICKEFCPMRTEDKNKGRVNPDASDCIRCLECLERCPEGAIKLGSRL